MIEQGLSRGTKLVMEKDFNVEALVMASKRNAITGEWEDNFGFDYLEESGFNPYIGVFPLDWFSQERIDLITQGTWSIHIEDARELRGSELTHMDKLYRIQFEDDNLNPSNTTLVNQVASSLIPKLTDPLYDDILLTVDMPPYYGHTDEQLTYFLDTVKPDMIFFNRYPWVYSADLHIRQLERGWYGMIAYHRRVAQGGLDRTGTTPIPFGAYTQTWHNGIDEIMPDSYFKYNHYLHLAFGAKSLSAFLYNDWIPSHEDLRTTLFDRVGNPTEQFYLQKELNKKIKNLGAVLKNLQTVSVKLIPATNVEHVAQNNHIGADFAWDYGDRPDAFLTSVTANIEGQGTQDVFVGFFKSLLKEDDIHFMVVNGAWSIGDVLKQSITLNFDFSSDKLKNLMKLNQDTGNYEIVELTKISENIYNVVLDIPEGEGQLFKYVEIEEPTPTIKLDAIEKGYYEVYVDDVKVSQHSKPNKAVSRGQEEKFANPNAYVYVKQPNIEMIVEVDLNK